MIVELKWDKSVKTAINQIKDNKYSEALKRYSGKLLIVGVNYNKEVKGERAKNMSVA